MSIIRRSGSMAGKATIAVGLAAMGALAVGLWMASGEHAHDHLESKAPVRTVAHRHHHHHNGHGHVHPEGEVHSCSLTAPLGVAACLDMATLSVVCVPFAEASLPGGRKAVSVEVLEVVAESEADGESEAVTVGSFITVVSDDDPAVADALPVGAELLLFLRHSDGGREGREAAHYYIVSPMNGAVWHREDACAGILPLARVLGATRSTRLEPMSFATRTRALVTAITSGGAVTRHRAALDFEYNQPLVDALTGEERVALAQVLATLDGIDHATAPLMTALSSSGDVSMVDPLVRTLAQPNGHRLIETLARVLSSPAIADVAASRLHSQATSATDPELALNAAWVLARIGAESAAPMLTSLLSHENADVVSEAMIGLAGENHEQALALARDTLRLAMASGPVTDPDTPVAKVIRTRDLHEIRTQRHRGERLRLLAAGYVVARSPLGFDREWLRARLDRITDWAAREFVRARLDNPWMAYDSPW